MFLLDNTTHLLSKYKFIPYSCRESLSLNKKFIFNELLKFKVSLSSVQPLTYLEVFKMQKSVFFDLNN